MDAPISITLAHLIIIWTLSVLLLAWMLVFAILALRVKTPKQDDTFIESRGSVSRIHTPHITDSTLFLDKAEAISSETLHYNAVSTSIANEEVPVTPVM